MILPSLRQLLTGTSGDGRVHAIIESRAYIGNAPQDERRPRVILNLLNEDFPQVFDGAADYTTGTVQAACLADTAEGADDLAHAVRSRLDGYEGFGVTAQVEVKHLEITSRTQIERAPFEGRSVPTFGVALTLYYMLQDDS